PHDVLPAVGGRLWIAVAPMRTRRGSWCNGKAGEKNVPCCGRGRSRLVSRPDPRKARARFAGQQGVAASRGGRGAGAAERMTQAKGAADAQRGLCPWPGPPRRLGGPVGLLVGQGQGG